MKSMTLKELCEASGATRRAIQGYEAKGLVEPTGRTNRGYLLYDEKSQERVKRIKIYQRAGFSLSEVSQIIDAPKQVQREALEVKILELEQSKSEIDDIIALLRQYIFDL